MTSRARSEPADRHLHSPPHTSPTTGSPADADLPPRPDPVRDVLRTPRLTLRPITIDDRDEFLRVIRQSRQHLARFSPLHLPGEADLALFDRQLSLAAAGEASGSAFRRIATDHLGRIVGAFNLNNITRGMEWAADCNWWVAADQTRRGYAVEGVTAIVQHALAELPFGLGLSRVAAYIQRRNTPSIKTALRAGFIRAGDECSYVQTGGNWDLHDLYIRRCSITP